MIRPGGLLVTVGPTPPDRAAFLVRTARTAPSPSRRTPAPVAQRPVTRHPGLRVSSRSGATGRRRMVTGDPHHRRDHWWDARHPQGPAVDPLRACSRAGHHGSGGERLPTDDHGADVMPSGQRDELADVDRDTGPVHDLVDLITQGRLVDDPHHPCARCRAPSTPGTSTSPSRFRRPGAARPASHRETPAGSCPAVRFVGRHDHSDAAARVRARSGRRWSRSGRSRAAGTAGSRPRATAGW